MAAISLANVPSLLPNHEMSAQMLNSSSAHAPNEIGEKLLNIRCGKLSDWNSMCQKRNDRPRSSVSKSPERTAPQNASA